MAENKWLTVLIITLVIGVINPVITGRGPTLHGSGKTRPKNPHGVWVRSKSEGWWNIFWCGQMVFHHASCWTISWGNCWTLRMFHIFQRNLMFWNVFFLIYPTTFLLPWLFDVCLNFSNRFVNPKPKYESMHQELCGWVEPRPARSQVVIQVGN